MAGFVNAKDVVKVNKEEMEALLKKDTEASRKALQAKKPEAYEDEFTENPDSLKGFDDEDFSDDAPSEPEEYAPEEPEELPEAPEEKPLPKATPKVSGQKVAEAIYGQGFQAGLIEGHKRARMEIIEKLMG